MSNRTESITIKVDGYLDHSPEINLDKIELEIYKDKRINTEDWDGIPSDYMVGSIVVSYDSIDHNDYENPIMDVEDDVFNEVRDDLFKCVIDTKITDQKYWYEPISNTEEK